MPERRGRAATAVKPEDDLAHLHLMQATVEHAHDYVLIVDWTGRAGAERIVYVNEAFSRITGYSREEALGRNPKALLCGAETDLALLRGMLGRVAAGSSVVLKLLHYCKDGSKVWLELSIFPLPDANGAVTHSITFGRDISERKLAAAALIRATLAEERYAALARETAERQRTAALLSHAAYHDPLTGLPNRAHVRIEITESVLMHDPVEAAAILRELRDLGIQLDMDDFGTGYSSLAYLHQFPLDALKIDRSFVSGLGSGVAHPEIVQTVIALARQLRLVVIAEGAETGKQERQLLALGCEYGQGYHFARPLDAPAAARYLDATQTLGGALGPPRTAPRDPAGKPPPEAPTRRPPHQAKALNSSKRPASSVDIGPGIPGDPAEDPGLRVGETVWRRRPTSHTCNRPAYPGLLRFLRLAYIPDTDPDAPPASSLYNSIFCGGSRRR